MTAYYIVLVIIVVFVSGVFIRARRAKNSPRLPVELEEPTTLMRVSTHPKLTKWIATLTTVAVIVILVWGVTYFHQIYVLRWRPLGKPSVRVERIMSASVTDVSVQLTNGQVQTFTHSSLLQHLPLTPCHLNAENIGSPPRKIVYITRVSRCLKTQFGDGTVELDINVRYVVLEDNSIWYYNNTDAILTNVIIIFLIGVVVPLTGALAAILFGALSIWRNLSRKQVKEDAN